MRILKTLLLLLCLLSGSAFAGDHTNVTNDAGAIATSTTTVLGSQPSPAIGLSGLPGSLPPQLLNQLPPPSYLLHGRLLELTAQFGDVVISGAKDAAQVTTDGKVATVTFAPSPQFAKYRAETSAGKEHLIARFSSRYAGNVRWLGTVMVSSKPGVVLLPPADRQFVWEALNAASNVSLKEVIIVPVPQGYGVTVGVTSDANAGGLSTSLAKITSLFLGIGPSFSTQSGTTMPTGTWSQQYIVLEEDADGIKFSIDMVTPPPKQAQVADTTGVEVALARKAAAEQAKAIADALERIGKQRLALEVSVPISERVWVDCPKEGCAAPKKGYYKYPQRRAVGNALTDTPQPKQ